MYIGYMLGLSYLSVSYLLHLVLSLYIIDQYLTHSKGLCYNRCLKDTTWRRVKSDDDMISYAEVVSVSASYSRCSILTFSSCTMTHLPHGLQLDFSYLVHIYSIYTIIYPYALPLLYHPFLTLKSLPKCNLMSRSQKVDLVFSYFLIFIILFLEPGLGLKWWDHTLVTSHNMVTSHEIYRRR